MKCEPIEYLVVEVPDNYVGSVMNKLGARKAELINMAPEAQGGTKLEFKIPSRALFGYRSELLTDTKGFGVMSSVLDSYEPYKGEVTERSRGSLVAFEDGVTTAYGLFNAQERCRLFVGVGLRYIRNGSRRKQPRRRYYRKRLQNKTLNKQPRKRKRRSVKIDHSHRFESGTMFGIYFRRRTCGSNAVFYPLTQSDTRPLRTYAHMGKK